MYITSTHRYAQKLVETHKHTLASAQCQGKSVEVGSSSCCIILFGMLFLFPGSKLRLHRPRLSSITYTHTLECFTHPCPRTTFEKTASDRCPKQKEKLEAKKTSEPDKKRHFLTLRVRALKGRSSSCFLVDSGHWRCP